MPKFEILSIKEDDDQSDRISCKHEEVFPNRQVLKISVTSKKNMTIHAKAANNHTATIINVFGIDIDSLIEFLQEARTFVSEEEMVNKLMGRK
jgi:hypothetical protein